MSKIDLTTAQLKAELKRRESSKQDKRKAYKELVSEHVPNLFKMLEGLSDRISDVKTTIFIETQELLKNKKEAYNVKATQQSHTLTAADGKTITLGYRVLDGWDDTVNEGIAKVSKFIASLAKDEDSAKLVSIINGLLKKDAKGNLKSSRVLEMQNMTEQFDNEDFTDGVEIISKSYQPTRSCYFIEASYKDEAGNRVSIPLSMSAVDFGDGAEDIDFTNL